MNETPSGRLRRTRQSTRQTANSSSTSSTPATPPVSRNPYKRPTYLASKERATPKDADKKLNTSVASTPRGGRRSRGRPPGSGSRGGTSVRGRSARPECVATRVDKRRSVSISNNSSKKRRRGGYNSHDYHYGSDFDSDENESEHDEHQGSSSDSDSAEDNTILEEAVESDSDSFTYSRALRLPSPPVPIWLEPDNNIEELEIPRSSDDLLLQREYVVKAVSIYEPLRRFHQIVRLTPFRFEDFCAALASEEQSALLAEIHIQLLKTMLREDDNNGTVYGPNEVKDSVQSILFFVDNLTWADSLRAYIESDSKWSELLKDITAVEYPFCGPELRIRVLSWLVDLLLTTNAVRETLLSEGSILHEDHCRSCNRLGELICCETCPAVYHLGCIDPPIREDEDPPDDWKCTICKKHKLSGVMDCTSELEKAGLLIRHEKLGHDRHGRKYWFLTRRILVESDDGNEVWYYTTPLQVEELLHRLDEDHYEASLVEAIKNQKEEIYAHMAITEKITSSQNSQHRKTYLDAENAFLKKVHADREALKIQETEEKARAEEEARLQKQKEEDEKARLEEEKRLKAEAEKKRKRQERLARRNKNKFIDYDDSLDCDLPPTPDDCGSSINSHPDENDESASNQDVDENEVKGEDEAQIKEEVNSEETPKSEDAKENSESEDKSSSGKEEVVSEPKEDTKTEIVPTVEQKPLPLVEKEFSSPKKNEDGEQVKEESSSPSSSDKPDCKIVTRSKTGSLTPKVNSDGDSDTVCTSGRSRKSKALYLDVDSEERVTRLKSTGLYKLGQEGSFRSYVNNYSTDTLALSKAQHNEERDRRRHMSHKFSLTLASECKWSGGQHGYRSTQVGTLRATLLHMETALPGTIMHVNWPMLRKAWITAVSACVTSKDFSKAMIALAACIRPVVFNPCWSENTGHVKMIRMTALEREERKKAEKRDKKDRDDEEDRLRLIPQFVKYSIPPKHQIYKQKGEEYRVHGRWGWLWMSTLRPNKPKDARKLGLLNGPNKHVIQVKNESGKVKTMLIDPVVFDKLMAKRSLSMGQKQAAVTNSTAKSEEETSISGQKEEANTTTEPGTVDSSSQDIVPVTPTKNEQEPGEKMEIDGENGGNVPEEASKSENESPVKGKDENGSVEEIKDDVSIIEKKDDDVSTVEKKDEDVSTVEKKDNDVSTVEKKDDVTTVEKSEDDPSIVEKKDDDPSIVEKKDNDGATVEKMDDSEEKKDVEPMVESNETETSVKSESEKESSNSTETNKGAELNQDCVVVKEEGSKELEKVADGSDKAVADEKPSTEELVRHDMSSISRKFKTELVNVSLGIVSANRILYPKIAHRIPILDNLLSRRLKWQGVEEKDYATKYGTETMKKVKDHVASSSKKSDTESRKSGGEPMEEDGIDENFPQAGIYTYKCYSNTCRTEASRAKPGEKKLFEGSCYSPMCRLKYCLYESQREKKDKTTNDKNKSFESLVKEIEEKRMYTQSSSCGKVYLKKLPDQLKKKRNQVKYPLTSGFRSIGSKKPSILIVPQYELKKLARTGGRSVLPIGFTSNPKAGSWAWPYPCGRPFFKTSWQFRTVHATSLASAAMQLRILYASIRWDDIQMKPPNSDGKNQITTDMEIITAEILNHRIVGRFMERVQYLRKKQIIPIDTPKTVRDVTPSRSGLRKRKRVESPLKSDPIITEEWVEEDKVDLWEIKFYGDKLDKKVEKKPDTPSTRMKSGVVLKHPEKYDPSATPPAPAPPVVSATKTAELMKETLETELKMQRAVHLSKRDNHAKINNTNANVAKTPTASQQLQQQNAAAGLPANPRSYSSVSTMASTIVSVANGGVTAKKNIAVKAKPANSPAETPANPVILNRKYPLANKPTPPPVQPTPAPPPVRSATPVSSPTANQVPAQRLTVYRSADGKLNVKGLLPGQQCYQTSDGKIHVTAAPQQQLAKPQVATPTPVTASALVASAQQQQQQKLIQPAPVNNVLQVQGSQMQSPMQSGIGGGCNENAVPVTTNTPAPVPAAPLINISNPTYKSNINPQTNNSTVKSPLPLQQPAAQQMVTYSTPKSSKKAKLGAQPTTTSLNFSSPVTQNTVTAGSLVFTTAKTPQIIRSPQINQQPGQYVIATSQNCQMQGQPTIALSSAGGVITTSGVNTKPLVASAIQSKPSQQLTVASQQSGANLAGILPGLAGSGNRILVNDGTKTMVINAGSLTQQQLQHLASQIQSKKVVMKPQPVAVQPPQQTVQIIQQSGSGLPIQVIQQQQPQMHGQQPHYVITTGGGTFHQVATIGGQQVLVKKVFKSQGMTDRSVAGSVAGTRLPSPVTLMASQTATPTQKSVIKVVDPNSPGILRTQSHTVSESVQTSATTPINMLPRTPMMHAGVSRAQGLPISIVSPSKAKVLQMPVSVPMVPALIPPAPTITVSSTSPKTVASVIQKAVPKIVPTPQKIQPQLQTPLTNVISVSSPVVPVTSLPQLPTAAVSSLPPKPPVQQIPMNTLASSSAITNTAQISNSPLQQNVHVPQTVPSLPNVPTLPALPNLPNSTSNTLNLPATPTAPVISNAANVPNVPPTPTVAASPTKPTTPQKPQKIVAQIFQTPTGPKVVIQGVQPGELTPAQMQQLQQQISKQLSSNIAIGAMASPPHRPPEASNATPPAPIMDNKAVNDAGRKTVVESQSVMAVRPSAPLLSPPPTPTPVQVPPKIMSPKVNSPSPVGKPMGLSDASSEISAIRPEMASPPLQQHLARLSAPHPTPPPPPPKATGTTPSTKPTPIFSSTESLMEAIEAVASARSTIVPTPKVSPRKSQKNTNVEGGAKSKKQKAAAKNALPKAEGEVIVAKKSLPTPLSPPVESPKVANALPPKMNAKIKAPPSPKTEQLVVAVKSAPPPLSSPPAPVTVNAVNVTPAPPPPPPPPVVDGPRFVLSQDLPTPVPNSTDTATFSPVVPSSVTPSEIAVSEECSVSSDSITSPFQATPVKSAQSSQPPSQPETSHNQPEPSPKATPNKKRSPKGDNNVKQVATTPSTVNNKLNSALFRQKELLKKDIFKKRGLLEKELTIDIQQEISEEISKSKKVSSPPNAQEVNAVQKTSQKRKASESKASSVATSVPTKNDSHRSGSGPPYSRNSRGPTPPKKRRKGNKLYCICKTPYDNSKFYVGCDVCSNWYHGDCIGITEEMSSCLSEYVCDACQVDSKKLYCLCRQPYDESQFYICCDTCQDWFHGRCVGILQAEASDIEEYVCPNCDSSTPLNHANLKPLSYEDYPLLSKLLKQIQTHKSSWPFLEPVDQSEAPNYYRVIKEPMDLQTVEFRVDEKCYSRLRDFIGDVTKIFDNCRYYNPAESPFYKSAESLEAFFAQKIALLRQRLS